MAPIVPCFPAAQHPLHAPVVVSQQCQCLCQGTLGSGQGLQLGKVQHLGAQGHLQLPAAAPRSLLWGQGHTHRDTLRAGTDTAATGNHAEGNGLCKGHGIPAGFGWEGPEIPALPWKEHLPPSRAAPSPALGHFHSIHQTFIDVNSILHTNFTPESQTQKGSGCLM